MFTCDGCGRGYGVTEERAVVRVFIEDSRCNHVEAECSHCGSVEVVFLGARRLERLVAVGGLRVRLAATADRELRDHAATAWALAGGPDGRVAGGSPAAEDRPAPEALTGEHEQLLSSFGLALDAVPDELLWDLLHRGEGPAEPGSREG